MRHLSATVLILGLLTLLLPACGDDDDGGGGGSEEDYVAQVEAICAEANDRENGIGMPPPGDRENPKYKQPGFRKKFAAIGEETLTELRELAPPEAEEAHARTMIASLETVYTSMEDFMKAEAANDGSASNTAIKRYELAYTDVAASAGPLGVSSCQGLGN